MDSERKIIHIDMDAFYAAVEQRDFPQYRGKPVVVGGSPRERGVVATCSYEARRFGIHSAMATARAYRLCPGAIFVAPRFDVYRQVSRQIRHIFAEFTDQIEPLSLDEAYLDVTRTAARTGSATAVARVIKRRIVEQTQLTASAGVSYNKFLAKIASDLDKPDGLTVITPKNGPGFIAKLSIGKFHGIGKATEAKMNRLGIYTGADLRGCELPFLQQHLGKFALFLYNISRGIDPRPVVSRRERKSISSETTFAKDLLAEKALREELKRIAAGLSRQVKQKKLQGRTLTLKVKYHDFNQITRSVSRERPIVEEGDMIVIAEQLLRRTEAGRRPVRLLGLGISNFRYDVVPGYSMQADLFD